MKEMSRRGAISILGGLLPVMELRRSSKHSRPRVSLERVGELRVSLHDDRGLLVNTLVIRRNEVLPGKWRELVCALGVP